MLALAIANSLIIDIGEIHEGIDLVAEKSQTSDDDILKSVATEISDMGMIVDSRTTAIKLDFVFSERFKGFNLPSKGIIEGEHMRIIKITP